MRGLLGAHTLQTTTPSALPASREVLQLKLKVKELRAKLAEQEQRARGERPHVAAVVAVNHAAGPVQRDEQAAAAEIARPRPATRALWACLTAGECVGQF